MYPWRRYEQAAAQEVGVEASPHRRLVDGRGQGGGGGECARSVGRRFLPPRVLPHARCSALGSIQTRRLRGNRADYRQCEDMVRESGENGLSLRSRPAMGRSRERVGARSPRIARRNVDPY